MRSWLKEEVQKYEDHYAERAQRGKPELLAATLWGGIANLHQAVREKQAWEYKENGVKYYAWLEHVVVNRKGIKDSASAIGEGKRSAQVHADVCEKLKALRWGFQLTSGEVKALESGDAPMPERMQTKLNEAIKALGAIYKKSSNLYNNMQVVGDPAVAAKMELKQALQDREYACMLYAV